MRRRYAILYGKKREEEKTNRQTPVDRLMLTLMHNSRETRFEPPFATLRPDGPAERGCAGTGQRGCHLRGRSCITVPVSRARCFRTQSTVPDLEHTPGSAGCPDGRCKAPGNFLGALFRARLQRELNDSLLKWPGQGWCPGGSGRISSTSWHALGVDSHRLESAPRPPNAVGAAFCNGDAAVEIVIELDPGSTTYQCTCFRCLSNTSRPLKV